MKIWKSFRYLGYDKETIDKCRSELDRDNMGSLKVVSRLLIMILIILEIFYTLFDNNPLRNVVCLLAGISMAVIYKYSDYLLKNADFRTYKKTDLLLSLFSAICFAIAIYLGTFAAKGEMAVPTIWMLFFAILIFNRLPQQNLTVVISAGVVFLFCSYLTKNAYIFKYDIMHAVTSALASLYVSYSKTRLKIENILSLDSLTHTNSEIMETVEEQEREAALLRHKANRDELTGFYKKLAFEHVVSGILENSGSSGVCALICMDIDNFKNVNDNFGHLFGDEVIKEIAHEIKAKAGPDDILGRFGGDEFLIFAGNCGGAQEILQKVSSLAGCCRKTYSVDGKRQTVSLSAGISLYPRDGSNYMKLFEKADSALYTAKRRGRDNCVLYPSR